MLRLLQPPFTAGIFGIPVSTACVAFLVLVVRDSKNKRGTVYLRLGWALAVINVVWQQYYIATTMYGPPEQAGPLVLRDLVASYLIWTAIPLLSTFWLMRKRNANNGLVRTGGPRTDRQAAQP